MTAEIPPPAENHAAASPPEPYAAPDDPFLVVGLGASAGGLAAFEDFFAGLPMNAEPGMAFVLIQHLAPDYKSMLTDLVQRFTRLPVHEAEDGMAVQINNIYVIAPNCDMAFFNGRLQLLEPTAPRGQRMPVDYFFRSLAQDRRSQAVGVILSGTGSDGTLGLRAIKDAGGTVLVQTADSAEFDGMPQSALATGLADYALPPRTMMSQLMAFATLALPKLTLPVPVRAPLNDSALRKIFVLLRAQTGHDFSQYKLGTIQRRIERRMAVHGIVHIDDYVAFIQGTPTEGDALFRDFLIGVTHFFRDVEAFQTLQGKVFDLLSNAKPDGVIRVWAAGCSTGEEAYSLAIVLQERMEELKRSYAVQVFATDIDSRAIAFARVGHYTESIAADVSPQRLARFFTQEPAGGGYRVNKNIRDMLVFSEQDVIKDPPFSRLDLISCRNLMIYFGVELQRKLIPLFHYALKPKGLLFLGTSEGVGDFGDLFSVLDRKSKLYLKKEDFGGRHSMALSRLFPLLSDLAPSAPRAPNRLVFPTKPPLKEMTEQALLRHLAPAAALVNAQGNIVYLQGRAGMYLELNPGEADVNNVLKMARKGMRMELTKALHTAQMTGETVTVAHLKVQVHDQLKPVNVTVIPVPLSRAPEQDRERATEPAQPPLYLVLFEDDVQWPSLMPPSGDRGATPLVAIPSNPMQEADTETRIAMLVSELQAKDEYIQSTHEELESSNEELKSSNEEMQSVNEELQSTNEEMETSKEELQSLNEELATVNAELNAKVIDLSRVNNDMNNLLAGTGIATVFVDLQLHILRFTPAASLLINLIPGDVGRPVGHIVSNLLGYDQLLSDARSVLDTLAPKETRVQTIAGRWFTLRMRPYRTLDNVIEGVVITFEDITEIKQVESELRSVNQLVRLAVVVRDAHDAITVQNLEGRTLAWNPGAVRMYGWTEAQALEMNIRERIPQDRQDDSIAKLMQLSRSEVLEPYATQRIALGGAVLDVWITSTALMNDTGQMYAIATTERLRKA